MFVRHVILDLIGLFLVANVCVYLLLMKIMGYVSCVVRRLKIATLVKIHISVQDVKQDLPLKMTSNNV